MGCRCYFRRRLDTCSSSCLRVTISRELWALQNSIMQDLRWFTSICSEMQSSTQTFDSILKAKAWVIIHDDWYRIWQECFIFRIVYNFFRTVLKIKSPSWTSSRRKCKRWSLGKTMPWIRPTPEKGRQRKRISRVLEKIAELMKKLTRIKDNIKAKASSWASQQKARRSQEISYQSNVHVSFFWMYIEDVLGGNRQTSGIYLLYFKKKSWNLLIN